VALEQAERTSDDKVAYHD